MLTRIALSFFFPFFLFVIILSQGCVKAQENEDELPSCEWCGAGEAPENLSWNTTIAGPDEEGELMVISGTMYKADGKTPAPGVILYMYHTNSKGIYPKRGDEKGNGKRHGYLRSWLRTGDNGKYRFTSIRPGSYPDTRAPRHVHMTVKEPGKDEYWLKTLFFEDDPFVTKKEYEDGYVIRMTMDEKGRWIGNLDIILRT